jgi:hypothetical protein
LDKIASFSSPVIITTCAEVGRFLRPCENYSLEESIALPPCYWNILAQAVLSVSIELLQGWRAV